VYVCVDSIYLHHSKPGIVDIVVADIAEVPGIDFEVPGIAVVELDTAVGLELDTVVEVVDTDFVGPGIVAEVVGIESVELGIAAEVPGIGYSDNHCTVPVEPVAAAAAESDTDYCPVEPAGFVVPVESGTDYSDIHYYSDHNYHIHYWPHPVQLHLLVLLQLLVLVLLRRPVVVLLA